MDQRMETLLTELKMYLDAQVAAFRTALREESRRNIEQAIARVEKTVQEGIAKARQRHESNLQKYQGMNLPQSLLERAERSANEDLESQIQFLRGLVEGFKEYCAKL